MKVTISGRLLRSHIKSGVAVASLADDRQILRNINLVATEKGLEITATDTITGLWIYLPSGADVVVHKPGRVVINAENFLRLIETVANKDVTLKATPRQFRVEAGGSKFRLCVEDANDYPKIPRFSSRKPWLTIKADLLVKMISRTAFCAHDESSFQLMHGLLVRADDRELRMVATNGQRLAVTTLALESDLDDSTDAGVRETVIPAEAAAHIKHIISKETTTIDVQWMSSFLNVRTSVGEVSIRALAGHYPHYQRGIPTDLTELNLDRKTMIEILKQTTAIKSPTTSFVGLQFRKDRMIFTSVAEGAGEAEVEHEFEWNRDDHEIVVNPDFMVETLATIRGDNVAFEVGNIMTPTVLREMSEESGLESFCVFAVVRQ